MDGLSPNRAWDAKAAELLAKQCAEQEADAAWEQELLATVGRINAFVARFLSEVRGLPPKDFLARQGKVVVGENGYFSFSSRITNFRLTIYLDGRWVFSEPMPPLTDYKSAPDCVFSGGPGGLEDGQLAHRHRGKIQLKQYEESALTSLVEYVVL